MKLCCGWCLMIYTPLHPEKFKGDKYSRVYCCKGCKDADSLFCEMVERDHRNLVAKQKKRLNSPRK